MNAGEIYTITLEAVSCSRSSEFHPKPCTAMTKDTFLMINIIMLIPGLPCFSQNLVGKGEMGDVMCLHVHP
jgi:hypothetical protein